VFVESHPRRSPNSFLTLAPIPCPLSRKSFPFIFFADPHPLTPLQSYCFKNSGGRPHSGLWIDSTSSHLPYILPSSVSRKSFTCRSYENTGDVGIFFPFWDTPTCRRFNVQTFRYPLSFHTLANSFARRKNSTPFFSSDSALFAKNHPGWGAPCLSFRDRQTRSQPMVKWSTPRRPAILVEA
jgi:hypothetical protein